MYTVYVLVGIITNPFGREQTMQMCGNLRGFPLYGAWSLGWYYIWPLFWYVFLRVPRTWDASGKWEPSQRLSKKHVGTLECWKRGHTQGTSLQGGPRNQLYIGAHNSTYGGERTPVTHVFSAFYRSYSHIYNWFSGAHLVIPMEPYVSSDQLEEQKCPKPTWAVIFKYSPRPFWHIPSLTPG